MNYYEVTVIVRHRLKIPASSEEAAKALAEATVAIERQAWKYSLDIETESVRKLEDKQ